MKRPDPHPPGRGSLAGQPLCWYKGRLLRTGHGRRSPGTLRGQARHLANYLIFLRLLHMSRVCEITGKGPAVGNRVSHANNKKRRRFLPNLHTQRFWLETEKRWVSLRISAHGLRTIEKKGIDQVVASLRAQGMKI